MLRRITTIWPNLVRRVRFADDDDQRPLLAQEGENAANPDPADANGLLRVDEDQLLADYRLLSWTRLMQIQDYESNLPRKWPLGPDVVEERGVFDRLLASWLSEVAVAQLAHFVKRLVGRPWLPTP